ncbi:MAG: TraB/GumN family protein [Cyclobacteriaceae bacterium]|nr:TraB/GumN family protein [Cyclobacteriaceae bacterium]
MKKHLIVLGFVLVSTSVLWAQENSILWEISGNGITKSSYLFGTLKFTGEKEFYFPQEAKDRIKRADLFAIEDQVDHHAQHELNKALHFPKGESLATHTTPEQYNQVVNLFEKELGISKSTFQAKYAHLKPLAISVAITRLALGEGVKFYDIELLKFAKANKVKTYSLEKVDREAAALNSFPISEQVLALLHGVTFFKEQKEEFIKLMNDYPQGKLDEIFEYTLHPLDNNEKFIEEFYYKRNEEWLPKIEKMIKSNVAFLSIGIGHLEGERGILALLKDKGYTLTPVKVSR